MNELKKALKEKQLNNAKIELKKGQLNTVYNDVLYNRCYIYEPEKINDKVKANIINTLFEDGYCNSDYTEPTKALNDFLTMIAKELGIIKPHFELSFDFTGDNGKADLENHITLYGCENSKIEKIIFKPSLTQIISTVIHENQHIKQFANMKEYLNGDEQIEGKYKIMTHFYIFEKLKHTKYDTIAHILNVNRYYYNPLELDARIISCDYLLDLLKNNYIKPEVKTQIAQFLNTITYEELHINNASKAYEHLTNYYFTYFQKNYGEFDRAKKLIDSFNKLGNEITNSQAHLKEYESTIYKKIWQAYLLNNDKTKKQKKETKPEMEQ